PDSTAASAANLCKADAAPMRSFLLEMEKMATTVEDAWWRQPGNGRLPIASLASRWHSLPISRAILNPFSLHRHLRRRFTDPRIATAVGEVLGMHGTAPRYAPAGARVLAAPLFNRGLWAPEGGA